MDKNEIIRGLEKISDYFFDVYREEANKETYAEAKDRYDVIESTLELLKEQEAKPVIKDMYGNAYCPHCSTVNTVEMGACKLHLGTRFCPYCGQEVKWE